MTAHKSCSRRSFLKTSALGLSGTLLLSDRAAGANSDVRLAVIGCGNMGSGHVKHFSQLAGVRLAAICDVDPERMKGKAPESVFTATDPRRILERNDIDAVIIATPDHWHAPLTVWACQAGKDVYVQKPVSHNIWEGRKMIEACLKYRRVVQAGTQYRSDEGLRQAAADIQSGQLGKPLWGHAVWYELRPSIGLKAPWTPTGLDYDLYCGPAEPHPLKRNQLHYDWHWMWSTGTGDLGNSGVHAFDICRMISGHKTLPPRAIAAGARLGYEDAGETPNTHFTVLDYDPVPLFIEIRNLPMKKGMQAMGHYRGIQEGVVFQCENGYFTGLRGGGCTYDNNGKRIKQYKGDGGGSHGPNFIQAVRERKPEILKAPIQECHISSACCHLGNLSCRLGAGAKSEAIQEALKGHKEASETIDRLLEHLAANEVDLTRTPLKLGPWLKVDAARDEISGAEGGVPDALSKARAIARGTYRKGFEVPENV